MLAREHRISVVVLDTSVVLNLLASGVMTEILTAVADRRVLTDQVHREVIVDPRKVPRVKDPALLAPWVDSGVLAPEKLGGDTLTTYLDLVGAAPPDDLGDGEAATIAWAAGEGAVAVLDDTKAIGVSRRRFGSVEVLTTLDLVKRAAAQRALPEAVLHDAIFDALRFARMRVPPEHDAWVRRAVGPERVALCTSLRRRG